MLSPRSTTLAMLTAVLITVLATGCGSSRPETISVSGTVTVDGKAPPGPGFLYFTISEAAEGFDIRPGTAPFDESGHYTAKAWDDTTGLVPGRYRVRCECWEVPLSMGGPPAKSYLAEDDDLKEMVVESGSGKQTVNLDFQGR